jgi:TPR repeat protein
MTPAVRSFKTAVDQGDDDGQCNYGACLDKGTGIAANVAEAARYSKMAADQGYADSQCRCGASLEYATGVAKNVAEAARYYKMAADQGSAQPCYSTDLVGRARKEHELQIEMSKQMINRGAADENGMPDIVSHWVLCLMSIHGSQA